jgi:phosphoglycolate phosphatase
MQHLLFDLDGTLTDPQLGITRCIRHALERLGVDLPPSINLVNYIGPPLPECFSQLLQTEDRARIHEAIHLFRERFSTIGLFENRVYEGIQDALAQLRSQDKQLYIATSKPEIYARQILDHYELSQYFQSIHGSTLDGSRRHKADIIQQALATNPIPLSDVWMIGDRKHDVLGATHHSIPCIGVLWGYGSEAELTGAGAVHLCEAPAHLHRLVNYTR